MRDPVIYIYDLCNAEKWMGCFAENDDARRLVFCFKCGSMEWNIHTRYSVNCMLCCMDTATSIVSDTIRIR